MNPLFLITVFVAIALGVWHLNLALQAIFVFRSGEPLFSWIAVLVGPASTLPAAVLAFFVKRAGGYWLVGSGILSFLVFAIGEHNVTENLLPFFLRISLPMILIGGLLTFLPRVRSYSVRS